MQRIVGTWTLKKKLMSGFLGMAALVAVVGWLGWRGVDHVQADLAEITVLTEEESSLRQAELSVFEMLAAEKDFVLSRVERDLDGHAALSAEFDSILARLRSRAVDARDAETIGALDALAKEKSEYAQNFAEIVRLTRAGEHQKATELSLTASDAEAKRMGTALEGLVQRAESRADADARDAGQTAQNTTEFMLTLTAIAVVVAILVGLFVSRAITRPIGEVVESLKDMSQGAGDLTRRLEVRTQDEVGDLANHFNRFVGTIHDIVSQVKTAADQVSTASQELASASEEIASGAQQQASSIEETAASLEEITATVKQNATNASQANQLATASREVADKGGAVVDSTIAAMSEINASAKRIADINTTIDEIAFQTNLLALNAAVEAARAGEQGRGFAVVAAEVRNLAQRSATAAKEIKGLIQDSVRKTEAGSELVNRSGSTLREIVGSVSRVTDIVGEIAAASREQAAGIEQVNKAVVQMDQVTQSNGAQTEELSGTAQALAAHGEQLQALVGRFKLEAQAASKPAAPAARPATPSANLAHVKAPRPSRSGAGHARAATHGSGGAARGGPKITSLSDAEHEGFEEF